MKFVRVYGYMLSKEKVNNQEVTVISMVCAYCEKGDLGDLIFDQSNALPWLKKLDILVNLANAVCDLHSSGFHNSYFFDSQIRNHSLRFETGKRVD